jgi:RNA polymerase sigma-70 factor, ECF subfamily
MNNGKGEPVAVGSVAMPFTDVLSQMFGEHYSRVLRAAYRITGNLADAEDVAQGVFLRMADGQEPVSNPGSYLYRAAINGALDVLRRRKTGAAEPLETATGLEAAGSGSSPEAETRGKELADFLRLAIGKLAPRAAEMFILRYVEELGNREIAAMMGTSQAVVAVTLHHARSKLKKRLKEYGRERQ